MDSTFLYDCGGALCAPKLREATQAPVIDKKKVRHKCQVIGLYRCSSGCHTTPSSTSLYCVGRRPIRLLPRRLAVLGLQTRVWDALPCFIWHLFKFSACLFPCGKVLREQVDTHTLAQ